MEIMGVKTKVLNSC